MNEVAPGTLEIQYSRAWRVIDGASDFVWANPRTWPPLVRRSYLLSLPISFPLRVAAAAILLAITSAMYFGGFLYEWGRSVWNGTRFEF
jgi:hypothetical protein